MAGMNESSWLADGVREIERITKTGMIVEPKVISNLPGEKPGTYAIVTPTTSGADPKIEIKVAGPLWHNERLETPSQLIAFIESMQERNVPPSDGAVYINQAAATYVFSFSDRRDRAVCPLTMSQPWSWLSTRQQPMTQRELIRVLRITFDGCLPSDSNLIAVVRNVTWTNDGNIESNLQRGKEALGQKIGRQVLGIENFPDEFTVKVRVFENVSYTVPVRVALEILPDVQRFEVIPFPNELADGMEETLEWMRTQIEATKVPAFIGAVKGGRQETD